jgi:hypothetical protein
MGTPGQASLRGGEEQLYSLRLATARHSMPPATSSASSSSMAYQAPTPHPPLYQLRSGSGMNIPDHISES